MIRKILLVIAFVTGLVALDRAIGALLRTAYAHTFTGEAGGQINDALQNRDRVIMIFGSSLARHQVDPSVLEMRCGASAFNAGCNGQDIYYARMLQSLLLAQGCESKHFVYVLNWRDLAEDEIDRARMFSVFVDESPVIRQILAASFEQRIKLQSHAYRFNTLAISTMRQLLAPEYEGHAGFVPISAEYSRSHRDFTGMERDRRQGLAPSEVAAMSAKLGLYRDFASEARRQNIAVTFVVTPTYREGRKRGTGERKVLQRLSIVAEETEANFIVLDEQTIPAFQDVRYFGDPRHLNARGAALFSQVLANCLNTGRPDVAKPQQVDDLE